MAEIIFWVKVIAYVSFPVFVIVTISWGFKKYKKKNGRLEIDQLFIIKIQPWQR